MPGDPGPVVRRRQLGAALRGYRLEAGKTVKDVAEHLLCSQAKISRIETAQRNASLRDVRDLCDLYGISDAQVREELMGLARGIRERAWWNEEDLDPALETLIGMEGSATNIKEFEPLALPGLLQTRDYAEAILAVYLPDDQLGQKTAVDIRMRRQQILEDRSPVTISVVLDEAALRRPVGGVAVMRRQLEHLLHLIEMQVVEIRAIPFSAGAHVGISGGFTILEFARPTSPAAEPIVPAVVYFESFYSGTYLDQPAAVQEHLAAFSKLQNQALNNRETLELVKSMLHEP